MAGSLSQALWPWSSRRSSSRGDSSATSRTATPPPPPSPRAAWRSPTIDQRVVGSGAAAFPSHHRSSSPPARLRRRDGLAVRFATPAACTPALASHLHRPWRAATPFPPNYAAVARGSAIPPSDTTEVHMPSVDMEPSRRLAYAFVKPARADPGLFIRLTLERHGGDPPVRLAASSYDTMMVVFGHPHFR
ncbi:unnamed protein product [Urochloa humidicola]